MSFTNTTQYKAAFKLLFGKAHTSNDKDIVNESKAANVILSAGQIFGQDINVSPAQAVADGVAEFVIFDLVVDSTTPLSYQAIYPTGHTLAGQVATNIIPEQFGEDFKVVLKNNGTEIPPLAASNWFLTPSNGVITSETALALTNGTLEAYRYIGETVQDQLSTISGGQVNPVLESKTLASQDITNQYIDLAHLTLNPSVQLVISGIVQTQGQDYSLSTIGSITRLSFTNSLAIGGVSALETGDTLTISYLY